MGTQSATTFHAFTFLRSMAALCGMFFVSGVRDLGLREVSRLLSQASQSKSELGFHASLACSQLVQILIPSIPAVQKTMPWRFTAPFRLWRVPRTGVPCLCCGEPRWRHMACDPGSGASSRSLDLRAHSRGLSCLPLQTAPLSPPATPTNGTEVPWWSWRAKCVWLQFWAFDRMDRLTLL